MYLDRKSRKTVSVSLSDNYGDNNSTIKTSNQNHASYSMKGFEEIKRIEFNDDDDESGTMSSRS